MWLLRCVCVVAAAAVVAADPGLRRLVEKLSARLETVEAEQKQQAAELSQLRQELQPRRQLQSGVASMRHELRQLSDHVRVRGTVAESLTEMRAEIDDMSREIRVMKDSAAAASSQSDAGADHTLVLWLKDMVDMLKGQVTDLAESFNSTALLQRQQNAESRQTLLEGDIRALEDAVQSARAHHRADAGQLVQLRADLAETLAKSQQQASTYSHLLDEVSNLRQELLYVPLRDHTTTSAPDPRPTISSTHRHQRRHRRHHRGHSRHGPFELRSVEHTLEQLQRQQRQCGAQVEAARANVTSLGERQRAARERAESAEARLTAVEREQQELAWQINVTNSRDSLRELQTSSRQLIREVEELETKVDGRLAEVRAQLARLEVAQAGLRTSVAHVIDEQRQLPALTQKVTQEMAALSQRQDLDRTSLLTLQSDLLGFALDERAPERPGS